MDAKNKLTIVGSFPNEPSVLPTTMFRQVQEDCKNWQMECRETTSSEHGMVIALVISSSRGHLHIMCTRCSLSTFPRGWRRGKGGPTPSWETVGH